MFSSKPNQLVLVSHAQLCLDESDSKVSETPITFFCFCIWILIERSYKLVFSSFCQGMLKDLRYSDPFLFIFFLLMLLCFI